MNSHRLVARVCEACGQAFQARAADVRRGFGRACSRICAGKCRRPAKVQAPASHPFTLGSHPQQGADGPKGDQP